MNQMVLRKIIINDDDADGVYQDWLATVDREDKMMALMLHDNYVTRFGLTKTAAAAEVGLLLGYNEKTVRLWRKDFIVNKGEFSESQHGKYASYIVLDDEEYRDKALAWARANTYSKGTPSMTAKQFCKWINDHLLPDVILYHPQVPQKISIHTATRWLHQIGFQPSPTHKGVYLDGHEREDVVQYRKLYLQKLEILEATHAQAPPCSDEPAPTDESSKKTLMMLRAHSTQMTAKDRCGQK